MPVDGTPGGRRRRFAGTNAVRGCPGWYYGLRVTYDDGSVTFDVYEPGGRKIEGLVASKYRTTTLARKMGDSRSGYQHVAREAVRDAS